MHTGGCMKAVPAQLALGLVNSWYAATVAWRLGSCGSGRSSSSRVAAGNVSCSRAVGLGPVPAAAWTSGPEPLAQSDAAIQAAAGSSQAIGLPGVVEAAVLSPRNTGTAVLRSRAGQQASADVL